MRPLLIGLHGKAGVGKDTAASLLVKNDGFQTIAFADPIRAGIQAIFGIPMSTLLDPILKEKIIPSIGKSPRQLMQLLGTEYGRELVNEDIWLDLARKNIVSMLEESPVIVTDVRFENEATMIRSMGGIVIHLTRHSAEAVAAHKSEAGLSSFFTDYIVKNDGDLHELHRSLRFMIDYYMVN